METTLDLTQFCANAWSWSLERFANALGLEPYDPITRRRFVDWQVAADFLRTLDAGEAEKLSVGP